MKKKDLKSGMLVKLWNESKYFVLKGTSRGNILVNTKDTKLCKGFSDFNSDMTHKRDKTFDVIAIYDSPNSMYFLNEDKYVELWRRYDNPTDKICMVNFPSNEDKAYAFLLPKEFAYAEEGDIVHVMTRKGHCVNAKVSKIYDEVITAIESNDLEGVELPLCKVVDVVVHTEMERIS